MPIKLSCPECGRCLGDTVKSVDCKLNCRGCKQTVHVKMLVAETADYIHFKKKKKGENNNDKS